MTEKVKCVIDGRIALNRVAYLPHQLNRNGRLLAEMKLMDLIDLFQLIG